MSRLVTLVRMVTRTVRAIIGVPDYERYVEHCRSNHPDDAPMTRDQFAIDLMERKYSKPGARCC